MQPADLYIWGTCRAVHNPEQHVASSSRFGVDKPKVSVVTPCFNGAETLPRYFAGIRAQYYPNLEVVFVNDGSTDDSEAVYRGLTKPQGVNSSARCVYVSQSNAGPCGAINTGLGYAQGEYLIFCDADDSLLPTAVEDFLKGFAHNPDCDMIYTRYNICSPDGCVLGRGPAMPLPPPEGVFDALLRRGMFIKAGAYCFRRRCLALLPNGRLDEGNYGQNLEILLHVAAKGRVAFWDATTVNLFADSNSRSRKRSVAALRRQVLDSKRLQLAMIRRYGCKPGTLRALRARFLPGESQLRFLEGSRKGTFRCVAEGLVVGRVTRRMLCHWLFGLTPWTRRYLAKRWYPDYVGASL